ncbi:hypothetical protein QCA50_006267 [Cerrena zonata]|uniref:Kynurenine 3-monooxygenase n=1 Tax=Cerrena zonata TaxID=2478898 RepID=A0AAW0GNI8_9APHY
MESPQARKAVIIGAGPVGCLTAIALAKQGWNVEVYEGRPDMRLPSSKLEAAATLRSINLTISPRGITAIQAIDPCAADRFLRATVPMHSRMVHDRKGRTTAQLYDRTGQTINSIDRALLNEGLLEDALRVPNVQIFFCHKVTSIDFNSYTMNVHDINGNKDVSVPFDFCIGADGSYSTVRRQLMRHVRMDFQQQYIPHEYLELRAPAGPPKEQGGETTYLMDPNHLHIWPRESYMLIALPNQDKTFTLTLFAPTEEFDRLTSPDVILSWFKAEFPDALKMIGESSLLNSFKRNPRSPLITIKAKPYHYKDHAIILGDAAHAMVPFYGQGLNCGLQDVHVLAHLLKTHGVDPTFRPAAGDEDLRLAKALQAYSDTRHDDLVSIGEFAMNNYIEMRATLTKPSFYIRKAIDNLLYILTAKPVIPTVQATGGVPDPFPTVRPSGWLPLYTMVTFRPDISYGTVKRKAQKQREILSYAGWVGAATLTLGTVTVSYLSLWHRLRR